MDRLEQLDPTLESRIDARTTALRESNEALKREIRQRKDVETTLRQREQRIEAMIESSFDAFISFDEDGVLLDWNRSAELTFGWRADEVIGLAKVDLVLPGYLHHATHSRLDLHAVTKAGKRIAVEMTISAYEAEDGRHFGAFLHDISERQQVHQVLEQKQDLLNAVTDNLPVLISCLDSEARFIYANSRFREWYGTEPAAMLGKSVEQCMGEVFATARKPYFDLCLRGDTVKYEMDYQRGAEERVLQTVLVPQMFEGRVQRVYALTTDVTTMRRHEASLRVLADTDVLTGLPNRRSYDRALFQAIARADRLGSTVALMVLDIDRFKHINDTYGHLTGDEVLKQFARRLENVVRKTDTVARLAGDEFTIVLEGQHQPEDCKRVGQKIIDAMRQPFMVSGLKLEVTTSIGLAWSNQRGTDPVRLSHQADEAMYQAKIAGRNQVCVSERELLVGAPITATN
jgi:diguanylate cyclase (GGDEF)-like protein/PAS domain S-box-containing protein